MAKCKYCGGDNTPWLRKCHKNCKRAFGHGRNEGQKAQRYTNKSGSVWTFESLDSLFETLRKRREAEKVLEYYAPKD